MLYIIPFARYLLPLALVHLVGTMLFQGLVPAAQIGFSYAVLVVVLAIVAFLLVMSCLAGFSPMKTTASGLSRRGLQQASCEKPSSAPKPRTSTQAPLRRRRHAINPQADTRRK
jgi:hypothetical protein